MENYNVLRWFGERDIVLEECFAQALKGYAEEYKKNTKCTLNDVYALLGIKKQHMSYWRSNPANTQTKTRFKQNVIATAGELFKLNNHEKESLANKAGLSLSAAEGFPDYLAGLIAAFPGGQCRLRDMALISDRMFTYIKKGHFLRREALLSVAIALGLSMDDIQVFLKKAGYTLSGSLPGDAVIIWLLHNDTKARNSRAPVIHINEVLDGLGLPLLMTREKRGGDF